MPEQIITFKTADGQIFDNLQEAEKHEAKLELFVLCREIFGNSHAHVVAEALLINGKRFVEVLTVALGLED